MSDFSELCPIFNTGVYSEITFPDIDMRNITLSGNALYGSLFPSITMQGYFTFGRTVVVTEAFARRRDGSSATMQVNLYLKHYSSVAVAGTVFATASINSLVSILDPYAYYPFTFSVSQTFTSTDILGLAPSLGALSGTGSYDLIVRYRDK
jgi:hypothetical protein